MEPWGLAVRPLGAAGAAVLVVAVFEYAEFPALV